MKKAGISLVVLAVVIVGGFLFLTVRDSGTDMLTDEEIEQVVLDQYPGELMELSLTDDLSAYHATVATDERVYELALDSQSGEVQSIKQTAWVNSGEQATESEDGEDGSSAKPDSVPEENAILNHNEIKEIALNEFTGTITELELDEEDGQMVYEVEIENNEDEATIEIDAYTGQIVKIEIDVDD